MRSVGWALIQSDPCPSKIRLGQSTAEGTGGHGRSREGGTGAHGDSLPFRSWGPTWGPRAVGAAPQAPRGQSGSVAWGIQGCTDEVGLQAGALASGPGSQLPVHPHCSTACPAPGGAARRACAPSSCPVPSLPPRQTELPPAPGVPRHSPLGGAASALGGHGWPQGLCCEPQPGRGGGRQCLCVRHTPCSRERFWGPPFWPVAPVLVVWSSWFRSSVSFHGHFYLMSGSWLLSWAPGDPGGPGQPCGSHFPLFQRMHRAPCFWKLRVSTQLVAWL